MGTAAELREFFQQLNRQKAESNALREEENVFDSSVHKREAKNDLNCSTRVRWENVSLFSAVNSLGQQIWLLVPFSICYKMCPRVQANAVVAPANF